MKVRKIDLDLNECSEVRILISKKVESIKTKLDTLADCASPDDPVDKGLLTYWSEKMSVLMSVYDKLCSNDIYEVENEE